MLVHKRIPTLGGVEGRVNLKTTKSIKNGRGKGGCCEVLVFGGGGGVKLRQNFTFGFSFSMYVNEKIFSYGLPDLYFSSPMVCHVLLPISMRRKNNISEEILSKFNVSLNLSLLLLSCCFFLNRRRHMCLFLFSVDPFFSSLP